MSRSAYFTGQPVMTQIMGLIDKAGIWRISQETPGSERYVKSFDGLSHLIVMLYAVLRHLDSLREIESTINSDITRFEHIGLTDTIRRSTLSDANMRRPQEFFAKVYSFLLGKYASFLANNAPKKADVDWEKTLYMMDSTTISLFSNILKGVGRHPKSGKKKGGIKVHTVMKYYEGVPMSVHLTSAAKHDHYLLREVDLPKDSTLAMDRAYIDYAQFQRLTEEGVCYVTKMKKGLKYTVSKRTYRMSPDGLVKYVEEYVTFKKEDIEHDARRVEIWKKGEKAPVVLLTNNFEFELEDIEQIYLRRWAIESLYYDKPAFM